MIILLRIPNVLPFLILFSFPSYLMGNKFCKKLDNKIVFRKILWASMLLGGLIFVFQWPITYLTQDIGADRTLFPLVVLLLFYAFYSAYLLGRTNLMGSKLTNYLTFAMLSLLLLWNAWQLVSQKIITDAYAKAYDARIEALREPMSFDTILLAPLPKSGFLYSAEITNHAGHYHNKHLKDGLGINAEIKIEFPKK
jgi:hypothetical protein